jgi:hypothetical protein
MNRNLIGSIYGRPSIDCSFNPESLANMAERFLEINQPETRIAYGSHVCKQIRMK